jgi:O-succinylbenzoic acid--CoA ligase
MKSASLTFNHRQYDNKALKHFAEGKVSGVNTPDWEKEIFRFILDWMNDSPVIVQYSSGTTGRSKKLQLQKTAMMRSAEATCRFFNLTREQTALLCLPVEYIAGKMMVVRCLQAGLNLAIVEPKAAPDISAVENIDFCAMVPLQVYNLRNNLGFLQRIRKLLVGGAEITPELVSLASAFSAEVFASYGMAETCSHIALRRLNGPEKQEDYHALPDISLGQDERGCLVIEAAYLPHKVITNDLVNFTGPDSFVWMGRFDNLINSGGIKIVPEELEMRIQEQTGLSCAIIGLPDLKHGQRLVLVAEKANSAFKESGIKSEIQKFLPPPLQIKDIILIEKLPRNSALKVDRKRLAGMVYPAL